MKTQVQGGGLNMRLPHFNISNLHTILRNRAYIGQKSYRDQGEMKYGPAVWEPIVDDGIFDQVQEILTKNTKRYKPPRPNRYPFLLSGIIECGTCRERLSGKSAHGKCAKIPYYEHSWLTKKKSCLVEKTMTCHPRRVLASRLEPAVWEQVEVLLRKPEVSERLLFEARKNAVDHGSEKEKERIKQRIYGYNSQLDSLTERLSQLPKNIPATSIFKQMEKIEGLRVEEEKKLRALDLEIGGPDTPAEPETYQSFLDGIRAIATSGTELAAEVKVRIVQALIYKIEIIPGTFKLHFHVGSAYVGRELANASSWPFFIVQTEEPGENWTRNSLESETPVEKPPIKNLFLKKCSNSLQNGVNDAKLISCCFH